MKIILRSVFFCSMIVFYISFALPIQRKGNNTFSAVKKSTKYGGGKRYVYRTDSLPRNLRQQYSMQEHGKRRARFMMRQNGPIPSHSPDDPYYPYDPVPSSSPDNTPSKSPGGKTSSKPSGGKNSSSKTPGGKNSSSKSPGGRTSSNKSPGSKSQSNAPDDSPPAMNEDDVEEVYETLEFDPDGRGEALQGLLHPFQILIVSDIAEEAHERTRMEFPEHSGNNDKADAFCHAYFSLRLSAEIGVEDAKEWGDAHERSSVNPIGVRIMDLRNNEVGRDLFESLDDPTPDESADAIKEAIREGRLTVEPVKVKRP